MSEETPPPASDPWIKKFLQHLATDRGASTYTQRNYRQALLEYHGWHQAERKQPPAWETLQRDDFRAYLFGTRELPTGPLGSLRPTSPAWDFQVLSADSVLAWAALGLLLLSLATTLTR